MGLFSRKKQDILPPINPSQQGNIPDLDALMAEAPLPPAELQSMPSMQQPMLSKQPGQDLPPLPSFSSMPPLSMPQMQIPPAPGSESSSQNELPAFDIPSPNQNFSSQQPVQPPIRPPIQQPFQQQQPRQQAPATNWASEQATKQGATEAQSSFELPDFDDEDIKEVESLNLNAEPLPPTKWDDEGETRPALTRISYPEDDPEKKQVAVPKEKYLDLLACVRSREVIDGIRALARDTEEMMEKHSSKATTEKYQQLGAVLGSMQEKLILVDNSLFDNQI